MFIFTIFPFCLCTTNLHVTLTENPKQNLFNLSKNEYFIPTCFTWQFYCECLLFLVQPFHTRFEPDFKHVCRDIKFSENVFNDTSRVQQINDMYINDQFNQNKNFRRRSEVLQTETKFTNLQNFKENSPTKVNVKSEGNAPPPAPMSYLSFQIDRQILVIFLTFYTFYLRLNIHLNSIFHLIIF